MIEFEDKLRDSAQRLATRDNQGLHVPDSPLAQKRSYWGWVATPAAAVAGIVLGMSMHLFVGNQPEIRYVQNHDTICIDRPVRDTVYITQTVEKVKVLTRHVEMPQQASAKRTRAVEEDDTTLCTSVQCDGINYATLALN